MTRHLLAVILAAGLALAPAAAQTANSSPASGSPGTGGNVDRTAPSGGAARPDPGVSRIGAETAVEKKAERQSEKDTSICKGC